MKENRCGSRYFATLMRALSEMCSKEKGIKVMYDCRCSVIAASGKKRSYNDKRELLVWKFATNRIIRAIFVQTRAALQLYKLLLLSSIAKKKLWNKKLF